MLTTEQENFFELLYIEDIVIDTEICNTVDLTIDEDHSFIMENGIVCHNSAMGSLMQRRTPESDGVYRLKGKIKNAKSISDLTKNSEIIDLMNILGLEPKGSTKCNFDKIVIATDWDPDGIGHIASLLINLFYKWFKFIIEQDKLFILITPLVSVDVSKERKYFYSMKEYGEYCVSTTEKYTNVRYLKGLGSLAVQDWEVIMRKRDCYRIYADRAANKFLWMSFDGKSLHRKKWLEGVY
jgi:DNA gyrase/topoisomerase IV subunit B